MEARGGKYVQCNGDRLDDKVYGIVCPLCPPVISELLHIFCFFRCLNAHRGCIIFHPKTPGDDGGSGRSRRHDHEDVVEVPSALLGRNEEPCPVHHSGC